MIEQHSKSERAVLLLVLLCLGACSRTQEADACRDHYQVHAGHRDDIAKLEIVLTSDGVLSKKLELPDSLVGAASPDNIFGLQTETDCVTSDVVIQSTEGRRVMTFESRCGEDNRLRQLDIALFDLLPNLDEVEVSMTTPATQKRFAINRQCDAPIFRLD